MRRPARPGPAEGHHEGRQASRHSSRSDDKEDRGGSLDRALEPDDCRGLDLAEGPRWRVSDVDRDHVEAPAPDEDVRRRPGERQSSRQPNPEQPPEVHPGGGGRARIEPIGHVDQGHERPAGRRLGEAGEEQPGPPGGPRTDDLRDSTTREAATEERVERRHPRCRRPARHPQLGADEEGREGRIGSQPGEIASKRAVGRHHPDPGRVVVPYEPTRILNMRRVLHRNH